MPPQPLPGNNPSPPVPKPGNPNDLSCSSQDCADAQAMVVNARNDIISTCGTIHDLNNRASALLGIAGGLFGLGGAIIGGFVSTIGVAATAALLVGTAIASQGLLVFLAFWLAVTLLATALLLLAAYVALLIAVAVVQGQLGGKRDTFNAAVAAVMKSCPNSCWGDLTLPSC